MPNQQEQSLKSNVNAQKVALHFWVGQDTKWEGEHSSHLDGSQFNEFNPRKRSKSGYWHFLGELVTEQIQEACV